MRPLPECPPPLTKHVTAEQITAFERCAADLIGRTDSPNIHTDEAKAREAGLTGPLIASGMVNVAYLNEYLTSWFGPAWVCGGHLAVAFIAPTRAGDTLSVGARATETQHSDEATVVSLEVWCERQDGTRTTAGTADLRVAWGQK